MTPTSHPRDSEPKEPPDPESAAEDSVDQLLLEAVNALDPSTSASLRRDGSGTLASEPSKLAWAEGTLVGGRYRLDCPLGAGGMGEVWAATHTITRRRVAMKFLKGAVLPRSEKRQRFLREARAASLVQHPNVVEVLDVFELEGGVPVMVMDLLIGETLGKKLARDKALPVGQALALVLPAVEAVEAAHAQGIVHRDLKPDNIFLSTGEAGEVVVKVLDFGIAKLTAKEGDAAESGHLTGTGSVLGTPWYMAPEQCYGEDDIDQRADVWALGVILYESLAGRRPVEGSNVGQLVKQMHREGVVPIEKRVPGLAPELARLIGRMLSRERADRPRDLGEVRETLARHAVLAPRAFRSVRASSALVAAAAVVVVAAAGWSVLRSASDGTSGRAAPGASALPMSEPPPIGASHVAVTVSAPPVGATADRPSENLAPLGPVAPQPSGLAQSNQTATRVRAATSPRLNDQAALPRSRSVPVAGAEPARDAPLVGTAATAPAASTRREDVGLYEKLPF